MLLETCTYLPRRYLPRRGVSHAKSTLLYHKCYEYSQSQVTKTSLELEHRMQGTDK